MLIVLISYIISFGLVAFMLPRVLILSLRKRLIDPIDPRKVHSVPASRLGGMTFYPSLLFSVWFCISLTHLTQSIFGVEVAIDVQMIMESLALLTLFMIGVYDDILGVPYKQKFIVQIFASALIIASGTYFNTLHGIFGINEVPAYVGIPITLFIYVFVTNAINLIDGIDGLASLLSIMALLAYGILLYLSGDLGSSIFAVATLGALVPFCYLNVFGVKRGAGSKIFMGDTGALVIGAILGFTAIKLWNITYDSDFSPVSSVYYVLAYTMLIVPCFDVVRIVIHRYRDHKPLFLPDKNHIHHKFMALGCSARVSLLWIIAINLAFVALNLLLSLAMVNITIIIMTDIVVWTLMHLYISRRVRLSKM